MARQKNLRDQMPMEFMLPDVDWTPPTSLPDLTGHGDLAIDLETRDDGLANDRGPGWYAGLGWVTGVVVTSEKQSVYAPVRHPDTTCFDTRQVGAWLRDHLRAPGRRFFHNAPYDSGWMWSEFGIEPDDYVIDDTMAMAFMLDENERHYNLDAVCARFGLAGKDETALRQAAEAFGYHPKKELWRLPARFVAPYAMQDGSSTLNLGRMLSAQIEAQGLTSAYRLEADLIPMIHHMRRRGVRVNTDKAEQAQKKLYAESREALRELTEKAAIGRDWDIRDVRSSTFMASMFSRVNETLPSQQRIPIPKTEKGNDSFASEWMSKHEHWLPKLCARALKTHDAAEKFLGNYILGFTHMGRIHAEVHQFKDDDGGTRTYRMAYSAPPLQQMPSRDEKIARQIREAFEPEEGELWGAIDYSQQEFRLMVHYAYVCNIAGADQAVRKYRDDPDTDFHDLAAELTKLQRRKAKDVNFAKAFGAGVNKFAMMTGMNAEEARATMAQYDELLPFIRGLSEFCQKRVDTRGFIKLIDGARGRFDRWEPRWTDYQKTREFLADLRSRGLQMPSLEACSRDEAVRRVRDPDHPWDGRIRRAFTHKSMNTLIQGSAARQMKAAMREVYRAGIIPLLQMHDELDISTGDERTGQIVAEIMRDVVKLEVPVKVDTEYGVNWGRAAKDKKTGYMATWDEAVKERNQ